MIVFAAQSQIITVKKYYEPDSLHIKEEFDVLKDNPTVLNGKYTSYFYNANKNREGFYNDNNAVGIWNFYYETGVLKMKGPFLKNKSDGYWKYYFENENLKMEGNLTENKKEGQWVYYHENGKVKSIGDYKHGIKQGAWVYNHEDGEFKAQAEYEHGKGTYYEFYNNGKIKMTGPIENEKSNGQWSYYRKDGSIESEGIERNGLKEGFWKFYYPSGEVKSEGEFNGGKASGNWKYYHENGNIKAEGKKKEDYKTGYWKVLFETGAIQSEADYNDSESGIYTEYYPSGKLKISGQYLDGEHHGIWKYYYEDGTLEGNCTFNQGIGYYKGYTSDGDLKIEGKLDGSEKIGTWTMYNNKGEVSGYYHTIDNNKTPVFSAVVERKKTLPSGHISQPKNKRWREFKNTSFAKAFASSKPGLDAFILSVSPISVVLGKYDLNAELWVRQKIGHEFQFQLLTTPLISNSSSSLTGQSIAYRFKIYNESILSGFVHFDNEIRYTNIACKTTATDTSNQNVNLKRTDNLFEYSFLFGHRFLLSKSKHRGKYRGWTADTYFGLGVGIRSFSKNWDDKLVPMVPISKSENPITIPIRMGINIGYSF